MSTCLQFTYGGDPSESPRDAVRFLIGDTNAKRALLDDREIDHAIAERVDHNMAAAFLADHLCARFTRDADVTVGAVSKKLGSVADAFRKKAADLRSEACRTAGVSFPSTHVSTTEVLEQNTDLTKHSFGVGQFDNPFAVQLDDLIGGDLNDFF